jgi:AcrR family transcriptional regulator
MVAGTPQSAQSLPPAGHRERLLFGLAESIREKGFWGTKISDVVRHARTSRRTFYEHFPDKEACFLELVEATTGQLLADVQAAVDAAASWDEQVDRAVDAYIASLTEDPAMAVTLTRELPALGGRGVAVQRRGIERFAELCVRLVDTAEFRRAGVAPVSLDTALMLVGGLNQIVVHTVERGDALERVGPAAKDVIKAVLDPERRRSALA